MYYVLYICKGILYIYEGLDGVLNSLFNINFGFIGFIKENITLIQ